MTAITQDNRDRPAAEYNAAGDGLLLQVYAVLAREGSSNLTDCALRAVAKARAAERPVGLKIVWHDGYGRDGISERLVATGIRTELEGNLMLEALRAGASAVDAYKLVSADYRLFAATDSN
jgi:hypothetical protein